MNIPMSVTSAVPKGPLDNHYFYHATEAMKHLELVANKTIPFINDDYAMLVNTLECFYKGFLQSKIDSDELVLPPGFLTVDHDLRKLVQEIERFTPLFVVNSVEDAKNKDRFLTNLRRAYTDARYTDNYTLEDFEKLYNLVQKQQAVLEYKLQSKDRYQTNDTMEMDL